MDYPEDELGGCVWPTIFLIVLVALMVYAGYKAMPSS